MLYCVLLYTQSALQSCGGLSSATTSVQHPLGLMRRLPQDNSASALTTHQLQVERRESHWCKWMGIIRRSWLTRASSGNLARTPGLHPYSFTRSAMGFLTTTESQDLGLMSHPKDRWSSERLMDGHLLKLKCKYSNILRYWILDFHEL